MNLNGVPDDVVCEDCNANGVADVCDVSCQVPSCVSPCGGSPDFNQNFVPDECEALPPVAAGPPHDIKKNRYISFDPAGQDIELAFEVTMTDSLAHPDAVGSTSGWVGVPDAQGVAGLEADPVVRLWPESVIHVADCKISPVATYDVRASADSGVTFTSPLPVDTIDRPGPKFWGDVVGFFIGTEWTEPNGLVNIDDLVAAIKSFNDPTAFNGTHVSVTDVVVQEPNRIVDTHDFTMLIKAFQGDPYPYGCPDDPCWDTRSPPDGQGSCPGAASGGGGSAPLGPATVSTLSLVPSANLILQGELINVDVFLDAADDLGGYQLDLEVTGGDAGSLFLVNQLIDTARGDNVFFGVSSLESVSPYWGQVGAAKFGGGGIPVTGPAYLGTFLFFSSADATGVFNIGFADIENNFLMNGQAFKITDTIADDVAIIEAAECWIDSDCDDGNDCTSDACVSGVCMSTNLPSNTTCDDGLFCTKRDKCDGAGVCVGTGDPCHGQNPECCEQTDTCDPVPCN